MARKDARGNYNDTPPMRARWEKILLIDRLLKSGKNKKEIILETDFSYKYVSQIMTENCILDVPQWYLKETRG